MHLADVNENLSHKIVGGIEHTWNCYPDARYLDYESEYAHASIIFSMVNQEVYEAEISIKRDMWDEDMRPYRWLNPDSKDFMIAEAKERNVKWRKAWDDVKYIDLETSEDFLEKAKAIFNGEKFDTRIQVPLELDDETMMQLFMEAHKRDITVNQMVEELLKHVIAKHNE